MELKTLMESLDSIAESDNDQILRNGMKGIATEMIHWAEQSENSEQAMSVMMYELQTLIASNDDWYYL